MNKPILRLHNLTYSIDGNYILKNICLELHEGSCMSIIGPNGAGKSTLLRCVAGILAYSGDIFFSEQNLNSFPPIKRAKMIGYVPQHFQTPHSIKVDDFLEMSLYPLSSRYGLPSPLHRERIEQVLEKTSSTDISQRFLHSLSGGELQRVLLASALLCEPTLLLLDEPTASLDPAHREKFQEILHELKISTILITHDINFACEFADSILALRKGTVHYHGEVDQHFISEVIPKLFEAKFLQISIPHRSLPALLPDYRRSK